MRVKHPMPSLRFTLAAAGLVSAWQLAASGQSPAQPAPAAPCTLTGIVTSGGTPLPGVALSIGSGASPASASSTDLDGAFRLRTPAGVTLTLRAELMGFAPLERVITVAPQPPCDARIDLTMTLGA